MYELRNVDADRMVRLGDVLDAVWEAVYGRRDPEYPAELMADIEAAVMEELL